MPLSEKSPAKMFSSSARLSGPVMTALEAREVRSDPAEENWRLRQNLALSYRVINDLNLNEGSCNHLSVMAPPASGAGEEVMLIGEKIVTMMRGSQSSP